VKDRDVGLIGEAAGQFRGESIVLFDKEQMFRPADEVVGDGAQPGTGFDDKLSVIGTDLIGDPAGEFCVHEEILPHALPGGHLLTADDL
jgi:hypothetical protein